MLYYGVITVCAAMFGIQFFFTEMFRSSYGSGLVPSLVSAAGGSVVGIAVLSVVGGFDFGYTHFSLLMAVLSSLNSFAFTFCSLAALGRINLSLYSLFSMLGGMALPFAAGILFFDEALTAGKCVCFVFIAMALLFTIEKGDKNGGGLYYAGIFVLNGMSGVISKVFQAAPFEKVTATQYSILCAVVSFGMSVIILLMLRKPIKLPDSRAVIAICGKGVLSRVANLLLVVSLVYLPASAQYPFITGGTMIFSTLISFFTAKKPSAKELIAVVLSFIGILFLVLIP